MFVLVSGVQPSDLALYTFFFIISSIIGYYKILSIVPCATQQVLVYSDLFYTQYCAYFNPKLLIYPPLPFPLGNHKLVFYVCGSISGDLFLREKNTICSGPTLLNITVESITRKIKSRHIRVIMMLTIKYNVLLLGSKEYNQSIEILSMSAKMLQLCPTLCDPVDCSLPGSSVHGILWARIQEWVARPSSRGST